MGDSHLHIALVEPSHLLCEGLSTILQKQSPHHKIYRFTHWVEFEESRVKEKINLVIINPYLFHFNSKHLLAIKRQYPSFTWVALVYTFIEKELLTCFDATIQITDSIAHIHAICAKYKESDYTMQEEQQSEQLSDREVDVLKQLAMGLSNKEIADKLNISIHTVISHRKNITQKTGIKSESGLTIYAISNKIISLENS